MVYEDDFRVANYTRFQKADVTRTVKSMTPYQRQCALERIQAHVLISDPVNVDEARRIIKMLKGEI